MSQTGPDERWRATVRLALITVAVLVVVLVAFFLMVETADTAGFPFGLVFAATGLPLAGVLLVFHFASRQAAVDRRYGLYED